jgi:hypothetical protein
MNRITAIGLWDVLKKAGHAFLKDKVPKYFAIKFGSEIKPNAFTTVIKNVQVESENKSVQQNEEEIDKLEKQTKKNTL